MDKRQEKLMADAYDMVYDLNSKFNNPKFNSLLDVLEKEASRLGYEFKLNEKTQKFKVKRVK